MKKLGFVSATVSGLLLGLTASVGAQQQQEERENQPVPPAAHETQEEKRAPQDDKKAQEQEKRQEKDNKQVQKDNKHLQQEDKHDQRDQKDEQRAAKQDNNNPQPKAMQNAHRAGGNSGGRIPDDKFRAHFGREHHFRVSRPTVVSGQPRFQYSGYWFVIGDPWPVGWDYADDCYIDFVDGEYLLFDLAHPGVSIVVSVSL